MDETVTNLVGRIDGPMSFRLILRHSRRLSSPSGTEDKVDAKDGGLSLALSDWSAELRILQNEERRRR